MLQAHSRMSHLVPIDSAKGCSPSPARLLRVCLRDVEREGVNDEGKYQVLLDSSEYLLLFWLGPP